MGSISMCPKCHGRLTAISERTGGFSGTKAVVGAVVAGPVGVAAGALGKKLVILQCEKCGYQIETDAQTAQEAEEFGVLYEQYARLHASRIPKPELIHKLGKGYHMDEFRTKGYVHRAEEREKIGVDIEAVERNVAQIEEKYDQEIQAAAAEVSQLEQKKDAKAQALSKLGFFKFSEKKTVQADIDSLGEQIDASISKAKDAYRRCDQEVVALRSEYVERCRILAHAAVDKYCPDDPVWKEFAHAAYSVMSGEPMTGDEIVKTLNGDMTGLQFRQRMEEIGNPFVSRNDNGWYFGPDGSQDYKWACSSGHIRSFVERVGEKLPSIRSDAEWAAQRQQNAVLAVSKDFVAAIRTNGTVAIACTDGSQYDASSWKNIVGVAASTRTASGDLFGVRSDGTVVMTGPTITDYPEVNGWRDIIAVAAGLSHVLGLRRNGTVVSAGKNFDGQCDVTEWEDIISIAACGCNSFGLRRDGTVVVVGDNIDDRLCNLEHWERIVSISACSGTIIGVRADGMIRRAGITTEDRMIHTPFVAASMRSELFENGEPVRLLGWPDSEEESAPDIIAVAVADVFIPDRRYSACIRLDGTLMIQGENLGRMAEANNWTGLYVAPELKEAIHKVEERKKQEKQRRAQKKQLEEKQEARRKQRAEFEAKYGKI